MKTINSVDRESGAFEAAEFFSKNKRQTRVKAVTTHGDEYVWAYRGPRKSTQEIYACMDLAR